MATEKTPITHNENGMDRSEKSYLIGSKAWRTQFNIRQERQGLIQVPRKGQVTQLETTDLDCSFLQVSSFGPYDPFESYADAQALSNLNGGFNGTVVKWKSAYVSGGGPVIKSRTIAAAPEKAVQLSNSRFSRKVGPITGWTKIRVGILFHATYSGGGLTGTPTFALGFCSGTDRMLGDASPRHFVGFRSTCANWGDFHASLVYLMNSGSDVTGNYCQISKNIAGVWTNASQSPTGGGNAGPDVGQGADTNVADRRVLLVDMIVGSPYTFRLFYSANASDTDVSLSTFLTLMQASTPSILGSNYQYGSAVSLAVDEPTNGIFDSVNCFWDQTASKLEVTALAFSKLA